MKDRDSRVLRLLRAIAPRNIIRSERGQAATELIVILPVFLALVFGLIELGKGFAYWVDMTHLAGEGGRYASVSWFPGCADNSTGNCSGATLKSFVAGETDTKELGNGEPTNPNAEVPTALSVSYCYPTPQGTGVTAGQPGSSLRVNVKSTYRLTLVHSAFRLLGATSVGVVHLASHSTIRLERPIDPDRLGQAAIPQC